LGKSICNNLNDSWDFPINYFPFIEKRQEDPMFKISLFKIRDFLAGNLANFLSSIGRVE